MLIPAMAVLACACFYAVLVVLAVGWRHRRPRPGDFTPGISILKPLKGVDDALEENLESFVALDYPEFELLLAAADANDPALEVARRVAARHPERVIRVFVFPDSIGTNPKVSLLAPLERHAQYDFVMVSDSNVAVKPDFLKRCVQPMEDARVGMVHSAIVGIEEKTLPAAFENLHLTCFSGVLGVCVPMLTGIHAVVGKNLLLRRTALNQSGGFFAIRRIIADDHELALQFLRSGWKLALADQPVATVNRQWQWDKFLSRHVRWSVIRWRLSPFSYPAELIANPVCLAVGVGVVGAPWNGPLELALLASAALLKLTGDAVACRGLRGAWPKPHHLLAMPLKDLTMGVVWTMPFFSSRIVWRGTPYYIARDGRMIRPEVWERWRQNRGRSVTTVETPAVESPTILTFPAKSRRDDKKRAA